MSDPWQVLGVSRNATDDEVKSAYRKLAHQYHPDLNPGDENAAKRMQEINAAYDQIKNPEAYRASQSASSGGAGYAEYQDPFGGGWNPFTGWGYGSYAGQQNQQRSRAGSADYDARIRAARNFINTQEYDQALHALDEVSPSERGAEWYFLSAAANFYVGNRITATQHAQNAVRLDPTNPAYQNLLNQLQQAADPYRARSGVTFAPGVGKLVAGVCLANVLCRLCFFCRL